MARTKKPNETVNIDITKLRSLFASKASKTPVKAGKVVKDDFDKFIDTIDVAIADMKAYKKSGNFKPKGWFKPSDGGQVTFKIGRSPIAIEGITSFDADNIDEAIELLEHSKNLVRVDEDVRAQVAAYYAKFSERKKKD